MKIREQHHPPFSLLLIYSQPQPEPQLEPEPEPEPEPELVQMESARVAPLQQPAEQHLVLGDGLDDNSVKPQHLVGGEPEPEDGAAQADAGATPTEAAAPADSGAVSPKQAKKNEKMRLKNEKRH